MNCEELLRRIAALKKGRKAVILAHNYELGEIQDAADFCGDSLELSRKAAELDNPVLVFCGVRFMAETAKILSPEKTVLIPRFEATCDMAEMLNGEQLRALKAQHPGCLTVCYVNTSAEVKAECDLCVTSGNALRIIAALPQDREILFVPDCNLGRYCAEVTGRKMIFFDGCCPVHHRLTPDMVARKRAEYPGAPVLIHPEAPAETRKACDAALSTAGILDYVRESDQSTFIIATEIGILHRLEKKNPSKRFIPLSPEAVCPWMKMIRLEDLLRTLETNSVEIQLDETLRRRAEAPIRSMLTFFSGGKRK